MLNRPLEQPDSAHPQRQQAEARAQLIMSLVWGSYLVVLLITLVFQIIIRLNECAGFASCATSLGKAVLWSMAWPFYWVFFLNL
jgi:hypothetical protein